MLSPQVNNRTVQALVAAAQPRQALRPLRVPVAVLAASDAVNESGVAEQLGHVLYEAMREGREVYGRP